MAKKRPAPKPKPRPNFPPLLVLEGEDADGPWIVAIRGVSYVPEPGEDDRPSYDHRGGVPQTPCG